MGAPTYKIRNRVASMLMNYGFSKYEGKKLFNKDDDVETIYLGLKDTLLQRQKMIYLKY